MFVTRRYMEALRHQSEHATCIIKYINDWLVMDPDKLCDEIKSGKLKKRIDMSLHVDPQLYEPKKISGEVKMLIWLWGVSMCAVGAAIGVMVVKLQLGVQ